MPHDNPIPLTDENLPALMVKHEDKIRDAVDNDSQKQQARLRLFDHDPAAMAAHYPELQKKSQELRARNEEVQKTAATAGWIAFAATAIATGYQASKKRISQSPLIQGFAVALSSIAAGLAGNFITDRLLGGSVREESKELATASRIAYERELAPYMEDTEHTLALRQQQEAQKAAPATEQPATDKQWTKANPAPADSFTARADQTKAANEAAFQQRA